MEQQHPADGEAKRSSATTRSMIKDVLSSQFRMEEAIAQLLSHQKLVSAELNNLTSSAPCMPLGGRIASGGSCSPGPGPVSGAPYSRQSKLSCVGREYGSTAVRQSVQGVRPSAREGDGPSLNKELVPSQAWQQASRRLLPRPAAQDKSASREGGADEEDADKALLGKTGGSKQRASLASSGSILFATSSRAGSASISSEALGSNGEEMDEVQLVDLDASAGESSDEPTKSYRSRKSDGKSDVTKSLEIWNGRPSNSTTRRGSLGEDFVSAMLPLKWPAVLERRSVKYAHNGGTHGSSFLVALDHAQSFREPSLRRSRGENGYRAMDPHHPVRQAWDLLGFVILLYDLIVMPFMLAWDLEYDGASFTVACLVTGFWSLDICMSFATGYYRDGIMEDRFGSVATHYVRTWFLLDILVVVADLAGLIASHALDESFRSVKFLKAGRLLRVFGLLRKLRDVWTSRRLLHGEYMGMLRIGMSISLALCASLLGCHLLACTWWSVGRGAESDTGSRWIKEYIDVNRDVSYRDAPFLYQYTASFHYVVALMTLGGVDILPTNSSERTFSIVCLLLALFYGGCLVSILSAAMVGYQMDLNKHRMILRKLADFLHEHNVDRSLALRCEFQVMARLSEPERHNESEVEALTMLSPALRSEVRQQVFQRDLLTHQIFYLFDGIHAPLMALLCNEAVDFLHVRKDDEVFSPGTYCIHAYLHKSGDMKYVQDPDSAPVAHVTEELVSTERWLCEAALWSEWIHVGLAAAITPCNLVTIQADKCAELCVKHQVVGGFYQEFCRGYHSRIISAKPPAAPWPTDLEVPFTEFTDIISSMEADTRIAVGLTLLRKHFGTTTIWTPTVTRRYETLKEQVVNGMSMVGLNAKGSIVRVVSVLALRIEDREGNILVQLAKGSAKFNEEKSEHIKSHDFAVANSMDMRGSSLDHSRCKTFGRADLESVCQLPGRKLEHGEIATEVLARVIKTKLRAFKGLVKVLKSERQVFEKESDALRVATTYQRTVVHLQVVGTPHFLPCTLSSDSSFAAEYQFKEKENRQLFDDLVDKELLAINSTDHTAIYAWLTPSQFASLSGANGGEVLKMWSRCVTIECMPETLYV